MYINVSLNEVNGAKNQVPKNYASKTLNTKNHDSRPIETKKPIKKI